MKTIFKNIFFLGMLGLLIVTISCKKKSPCDPVGGNNDLNSCASDTFFLSIDSVRNSSVGQSNGYVSVTTSPAGSYTYNINGSAFQNSGIFTGLSAGTYTIKSKSERGCIDSISVTLHSIDPCVGVNITVTIQQISNPTNGQSNGSITVSASPSGIYTFSKDGVGFQNSGSFSGLAEGTYTITAKNQNGCIGSAIIVLSNISNTCNTNALNNNLTYGSMTDQDGNEYKTIQIGSQTWMAENLKVRRYRNGDLIPLSTSNADWATRISGATCWQNNDSTTNDCAHGKIYNWFAVTDSRNLCPTGWHVPSDTEFNTLSDYLGGNTIAGGKLKSISTVWLNPNTDAINSSGFSGMPSGSRVFNSGAFSAIGGQGYYWSSTNYISNLSYYYALLFNNSEFVKDFVDKKYGFSVRCIKD
jgi:uncharacterized protein (TIGR02145 family)